MRGGSTSGAPEWFARLSRQMRPSVAVTSAVVPSCRNAMSSNGGTSDENCSSPAANSADRSTARIASAVARLTVIEPATWISGRGAALTHQTPTRIASTRMMTSRLIAQRLCARVSWCPRDSSAGCAASGSCLRASRSAALKTTRVRLAPLTRRTRHSAR